MSINSALGTAVTGLAVNQRGLEIASHNIGNANTEGYSRKIAHRESISSSGAAGGVQIAKIERAAETFITNQLRTEVASFGRSEVKDRFLTNTQNMFGTLASDSSIGQRLADLTARMETLAVEPESSTGANAMVDAAVLFARDLNNISDEIVRLRRQADLEIENAVDAINADLEIVAKLNEQIASLQGKNADSGDLEDRRDQALKRIATEINIKTFQRSSGEIVIYTGDSRPLLDGDPIPLQYESSSNGILGTTYDDLTLADGAVIQRDIRDGRIRGLLDVRDQVLPNLHKQIDAFAENVRDMANLAHNRGMGLPGANALTGGRVFENPATDLITVSSDVRFVVTDAEGMTVAAFDLPAGSYTIDGVAAAIDAGLGADGSAVVANGQLRLTAAASDNAVGLVDLNGGADAQISFDDGSGAEAFAGFSNFFGLNDLFQTPGAVEGDDPTNIAGALQVRADIVDDPKLLARGRVTLAATTPVAGADRAIAVGDGSVVGELAAIFSADRAMPAVGGLPAITKPIHEYAAEILGLNSQLAADSAERLAFEEALVAQFQTRLSDRTAVNVDEELANILILQNAFSASARVITTADEMMQTLMQMKR